MDLRPSLTSFVARKLNMDEVPGINRNFESFGYSTKLSFMNYGSSSFLFLAIPAVAIVTKILSATGFNGISQRATQLNNAIFWNAILGYCYEMYTVIAVCSIMNFYYFTFNNIGNIINSLFAILFAIITVVLPIFYAGFYFKNFQKLFDRDPVVVSRFGTLT